MGLFFALKLTIPVSEWLIGKTDYFEVFAILIFIGLFLLLSFLIKMSARLLKNAVDITPFGILDNVAGAIAGSFKVGFILSTLLWVFSSVGIDFHDFYATNSVIFPYIFEVAPAVFDVLGYVIPMMRDLIDSMDKIPNKKNTHIALLI